MHAEFVRFEGFDPGRSSYSAEGIDLVGDAIGLGLRSPAAGSVWLEVPAELEVLVPFGDVDADVICRRGTAVQRGRLTGDLISITPAGVQRTVVWKRSAECLVLRIPSPTLAQEARRQASLAPSEVREQAAIRDEFVRQLALLLRFDTLGSTAAAEAPLPAKWRLLARHLLRVHSGPAWVARSSRSAAAH